MHRSFCLQTTDNHRLSQRLQAFQFISLFSNSLQKMQRVFLYVSLFQCFHSFGKLFKLHLYNRNTLCEVVVLLHFLCQMLDLVIGHGSRFAVGQDHAKQRYSARNYCHQNCFTHLLNSSIAESKSLNVSTTSIALE